eukprot:7385018-Prymnesium_polylepis.1
MRGASGCRRAAVRVCARRWLPPPCAPARAQKHALLRGSFPPLRSCPRCRSPRCTPEPRA